MAWAMVAGGAIAAVGGIVASNNASSSAEGIANQASSGNLAAIQSQERMSQKNLDMQQQQFDYFKDRQVHVDEVADDVTKRQLAMSEETAAQGRDLYNYQKDVFRPVEQSLVSQAMRESAPAYYEQYAQKAIATQQAANANAQGAAERNLASMGVNPNSGAWAAGQRGIQLGNAAGLGGLANDSRDKAEALGWAKQAEVTGLGKGLVGAGNASYGLAQQSDMNATSATNNANGQAAGTLGTPTQYGGLAVQGQSNAVSGYGDLYRTSTNAAQQQLATATAQTNAGMGAFGQMAQMYMSKTMKPAGTA